MRSFRSGLLYPALSPAGDDDVPMAMLTSIATTPTVPNTTTASSSEMAASLAGAILLLLLLLLFFFACRPWRFFLSLSSSARSLSSYRPASSAVEADNLENPLLFENVDNISHGRYDMPESFPEASRIQIDGDTSSPKVQGFVSKKQIQPTNSCASQVDSLVLNISNEISQGCQVHSMLRSSAIPSCPVDEIRQIQGDFSFDIDKRKNLVSAFTNKKSPRSSLTLEVVAGPSCGLLCSRESADTSILPLTLGRLSPSDLLFKDSEVSGKHAYINWNMNSLKWELVDKGSLNGTFLNDQAINQTDFGSRNWSESVELADGDVITLGTTSKISVKISQYFEHQIPSGVGIACDSMCARRGGKKLPMEDMCCCHCPLNGVEQFGLFGVFDGHAGAGAAKAASHPAAHETELPDRFVLVCTDSNPLVESSKGRQHSKLQPTSASAAQVYHCPSAGLSPDRYKPASRMLPDNMASILSHPERRAYVLSSCDASGILRDAFTCTEAAMNHQYEGCTATVLLIWFNNDGLFAQCANVGDSACVVNVDGEPITMTEDHRVTSATERARFAKIGKPLKDGEARLCGINICRMLGDKFLKEQDERFTSEPYISGVVAIEKTSTAFALMASDGLWDVIGVKRAAHLALQMKQKTNFDEQKTADAIAKDILDEARKLKTEDNTTVIFLDFDVLRTESCTIEDEV